MRNIYQEARAYSPQSAHRFGQVERLKRIEGVLRGEKELVTLWPREYKTFTLEAEVRQRVSRLDSRISSNENSGVIKRTYRDFLIWRRDRQLQKLATHLENSLGTDVRTLASTSTAIAARSDSHPSAQTIARAVAPQRA